MNKEEFKTFTLRDVISRMKKLDNCSRLYWIGEILREFRYREEAYRIGYEQGKFEGSWVGEQLKDADKIRCELNKVKVPQSVAEIIEYYKGQNAMLYDALREKNFNKQYNEWLMNEQDAYNKVARAWLDGYEVEKEKKYKVVLLNYNDGHLNLVNVRTLGENIIFFTKKTQFEPRSLELTKAEIISSGFGWVFDCPGIKIEEVE
jgi:hypothetical protein